MVVYKYQGAGNDFVMIDGRDSEKVFSEDEIRHLCDRRYGIGADGLIIFDSSSLYDFSMKYYNSDGSSGMMCGNGGRCVISFASSRGIKPRSMDGRFVFEAPDGIHSGEVLSTDGRRSQVRLKMSDVHLVEPFWEGLYMNTGCPHLVLSSISGIEKINLAEEGPRWRYDPSFSPVGTNVNWAEIQNDMLRVRTFEKGVEGETPACGTGVIAAAIASFIRFGAGAPMFESTGAGLLKCHVRTNRDDLFVEFRPSARAPYTDIWLTGSAEEVFTAQM